MQGMATRGTRSITGGRELHANISEMSLISPKPPRTQLESSKHSKYLNADDSFTAFRKSIEYDREPYIVSASTSFRVSPKESVGRTSSPLDSRRDRKRYRDEDIAATSISTEPPALDSPRNKRRSRDEDFTPSDRSTESSRLTESDTDSRRVVSESESEKPIFKSLERFYLDDFTAFGTHLRDEPDSAKTKPSGSYTPPCGARTKSSITYPADNDGNKPSTSLMPVSIVKAKPSVTYMSASRAETKPSASYKPLPSANTKSSLSNSRDETKPSASYMQNHTSYKPELYAPCGTTKRDCATCCNLLEDHYEVRPVPSIMPPEELNKLRIEFQEATRRIEQVLSALSTVGIVQKQS
ncbi:hypothetical protein JTB14_030472 [Gonioctena quinquepunctata]|nr:hypothetical protein JTB14_030472 [Gonioctena quinquepunctata]